ncbi:hypothetical protein A2803_00535 [Candidatus Woesebacteria bacterium RIFCSPHIGHO2_01_FULL_44_21]|uniref:N-acetyltransferase domain-containing protein n=1 Tax=Candidatus Woesebacteria bacterium RIFCSPHIGHO2_01_FULL_44_21 TaxID=1802503 RepID=A0A1F7YWG8_9BACT|nr:MAG: hypothetical protein A2803_00535 [Candidatus Woesebacteria bacterium RIFCSPHIGHO2_01_FULL_44_21]OGM68960.1 MAG: hypothetical protein A2897_02310 [Candidatus Woesebacteria bacterium RIFCSPLOWO2_01_FULL_44_24b]
MSLRCESEVLCAPIKDKLKHPPRGAEYQPFFISGDAVREDFRDILYLFSNFDQSNSNKELVSSVSNDLARDGTVAVALKAGKTFSALIVAQPFEVKDREKKSLQITGLYLGRAVLADDVGATRALLNELKERAKEKNISRIEWIGDTENKPLLDEVCGMKGVRFGKKYKYSIDLGEDSH